MEHYKNYKFMEALKFKTTIKCSGCVANVTPFLNEALGEGNWEVDYINPAKVLTVAGENDKQKIIRAVEKAGYKAEAL
jgi:copper chaperone